MGRKINVVATIISICLAFEVSAKEGRRPYIREASEAEIALLPAAIVGFLDNSRSAKFKDVRVLVTTLDGDTLPLCGNVSAKNSDGTYSGYSSFYGSVIPLRSGGEEVQVLVVDPADRPGPAVESCSMAGL